MKKKILNASRKIFLQLQMLYIEIRDVNSDIYPYFRSIFRRGCKERIKVNCYAIVYAFFLEDGNILLFKCLEQTQGQTKYSESSSYGTMGEHLPSTTFETRMFPLSNNLIAHLSSFI